MGFSTKVQLIQREKSEQWYINFPSAVAQAMEFEKGEVVEWLMEDRQHLVLRRERPPGPFMKKNGRFAPRLLGGVVCPSSSGFRANPHLATGTGTGEVTPTRYASGEAMTVV